MKILRWVAVVIVLLAAALAPAAPVIREAWPSTRRARFRPSVAARVVILPWAVAGTLAAWRDIGAGRLRVAYYVPQNERPLFSTLLWTRHRIRLMPPRRDARGVAYQYAMLREVERRYGPGVVERVAEEARREHAASASAAVTLARPTR